MNNNNFNNNINIEETPKEPHELSERKKRLFDKAKKLSLTPEEKAAGRLSIKNFMESRPSPSASAAPSPVQSPYFNNLTTFFGFLSASVRKKALVPIAAVLIFTLAVGTTFAAGDALPGDALYPVKINVNEKIEVFLAVDAKAKAKVAANHAITRLAEAEKLAERGRLNMETKASLEVRFAEQAENVKRITDGIKDDGDAEEAINANSDFEMKLNEHQKTIAAIAEGFGASSTEKESLSHLRDEVRKHILASSRHRENLESFASASSSIMMAKSSAKNELENSRGKIKEVEEYLDDESDTADASADTADEDVTAEIEDRLNAAKDELMEGREKLEVGAYGDAVVLFKRAHKKAEEARQNMRDLSGQSGKDSSLEDTRSFGRDSDN